MLVVDGIAWGVAYGFYIICDKRPIRLRCPKCKKIILSNTPWVCGFCGKENRNANKNPFVDKCGHCEDEPKAYRCHHKINEKPCGELNFLTADPIERGYAYCVSSPPASPDNEPEPVPRARVLKEHEEVKQDQQHRVDLAKLEAEWKQYNDLTKEPKIKTPLDQKKAMADNEYSAMMGIHEWADKKRAEATELYKNEPDKLKNANEEIAKIERKYS